MIMKKYLYSWMTIMMVTTMNVGFISCGGDDNNDEIIDVTPISMYSDGQKSIEGADTITCSNRFVAYTRGNTVYGFHVGEALLNVNGKKTVKLTVLPKYSLYDDPICNWGCGKDYVKSNQKQGKLSSKSTDETLIYENAGGATALMYHFENGKLKSIGAIVSTNHASQYADYLTERYLMLPLYQGADIYFVGADGLTLAEANTAVVMQVYSYKDLITVYMPAKDYSTTRSYGDISGMEEDVKEFVTLIKKQQIIANE